MTLTKCSCDAIQPGQMYTDTSGHSLYLRISDSSSDVNTIHLYSTYTNMPIGLCHDTGDHKVYLILNANSVIKMFGKIIDAACKELNKC